MTDYNIIIKQMEALAEEEQGLIPVMANASALSTDEYWGDVAPGTTKYYTIRNVPNDQTGSVIFDYRVTNPMTVSIIITPTFPNPYSLDGISNNAYVFTDILNSDDPNDENAKRKILELEVLPWIDKWEYEPNKFRTVGIQEGNGSIIN